MASTCELTGKRGQFGHKVSRSINRTNHLRKPNIQKKTLIIDGKKLSLNISTQAIRTLRKKGLLN